MCDYASMRKDSVLVSMGDFQNYGGWVLDTQFAAVMGIPYLLAHGTGVPVADAQTTVRFAETGTYYAKVYTYNWVAPWKAEYAPGTFEVRVGGTALSQVFGTEGDSWHWQDGGAVEITDPETMVSLHDLTGFEGRCGLVFFTKRQDFTPPVELEELTAFYRVLTGNEGYAEERGFDFIICGGGIPGISCALTSARNGLKTALIQDRPVVGGNNSSEGRVWLGGGTNFDPFPGIGNVVSELEQERKAHYGCTNVGELYEDDKKLALLQKEPNLTLYLNHIVTDTIMDQNRIKSVVLFDVKQNCYRKFDGELFLDSTGDAGLGFLAGADFEVTTNGHMGMTNHWHIEDMGSPQTFPRCPWAIDLSNADFPGRIGTKDVYDKEGEGLPWLLVLGKRL